jgi:Uri superfamily endonuclease
MSAPTPDEAGPPGPDAVSPAGARGTYLIHLRLDRARVVVVRQRGREGRRTRSRSYRLAAGHYLYVGSAFGPGGLEARVGRHLSSGAGKAASWDIDFLLSPRPDRLEAWGLPASSRGAECRWATAIAEARGCSPVVGTLEGRPQADRGFGAGDCRSRCGCPDGAPDGRRTHLFRLGWRPDLRRLRRLLGARLVPLRFDAAARASTRANRSREGTRPGSSRPP